MHEYQNLKFIFLNFLFLLSPFEDIEDSLGKDISDCEEIVSFQSLSDAKDSFANFFFVDDLPEISSFNEQFQEEIEK